MKRHAKRNDDIVVADARCQLCRKREREREREKERKSDREGGENK